MDETMENRLRCYMKDCGIGRKDAEQYLRLAAENSTLDQICFLKHHRIKVMEQLHTAERQIDCVDFVIHELEENLNKEKENNNGLS